MYKPIEVTQNIHLITVNDRRTHLFENLWPLERGISYNAYVICDEKNALVDTVDGRWSEEYIEQVKSQIPKGQTIDYLIINHMEPDHSGVIRLLKREFPEIQLIGNKVTAKLLKNLFDIDKMHITVEDGTELSLGKHQLQFFITPWLHWPETMMTYEKTEQILFSADAFGSFGTLDGNIFDDEININDFEDEMRRYYSNIVGKYSKMVAKTLKKFDSIAVSKILSTHGPLWRSNIGKVVDLYQKWSNFETENGVVIVFGSMYGNTEKMADAIARRLAEKGVKNIKIFDASKTHVSYIISEVWKYKAVLLGSPAYNGCLYPSMEHVIHEFKHLNIKEHLVGIFGSASWNGGGVKNLRTFAEDMKWEMPGDWVEAKGSPKANDFENCMLLADNIAQRLKDEFAG